MKLGRRKLVLAVGAAIALAAGVVSFAAGEVLWLVALTFLTVLATSLLVLVTLIDLKRTTDRRLRQLERRVVGAVQEQLADEAFVTNLRGLALPQAHADQLVRTIEAANRRVETAVDQLRERLDGGGPIVDPRRPQ
jgi:signal transduction histidine kinase